jgi:hypothetical protein
VGRFDGHVHLIRSAQDIPGAVDHLSRERVLGFDTESRPSFQKGRTYPPALLQLAGARSVYLFQLRHTGLADSLRGILASPDHVTVVSGVELILPILSLDLDSL